MIGFLRGEVLEHVDGRMTVLTGTGVGYAVNVPASYVPLAQGARIELFVHTHVREDALELFGFQARAEKELFLTLLGVNGIGPKGALGILSGCNPAELVRAILDGDRAKLTAVPGIGKKTAERVVLELAEPVAKKVAAGLLPGAANTVVRLQRDEIAGESELMRDAKAALIGLGYREPDAAALLKRSSVAGAPPAASVEELVRTALRQRI